MPQDSVTSLFSSIFQESPSLPVSLATLLIFWALFLWAAVRIVEHREYVLEQ
jgi:hypothetical protein